MDAMFGREKRMLVGIKLAEHQQTRMNTCASERSDEKKELKRSKNPYVGGPSRMRKARQEK